MERIVLGQATESYNKQQLKREIELYYNNFNDKMSQQLRNIMNKYSYEDIKRSWNEINWNKSNRTNKTSLYLLIEELKRNSKYR